MNYHIGRIVLGSMCVGVSVRLGWSGIRVAGFSLHHGGCVRLMLVRSIRRTPSQLHSLQQIPTQHDMLPQHLVYKNELNREYVMTLARNDETP